MPRDLDEDAFGDYLTFGFTPPPSTLFRGVGKLGPGERMVGARPVPRKFVITYKDEPDSPEFTAIFSNWDFTTQLPDFVFQFEPPPGAAKIDVKEIREESQSHKTEKQSK